MFGCGRLNASASRDSTDSSIGAVDSSPAPRCNPASPFGAPVPVGEVNTAASEENAYLSPDELTMYFSSTRRGSLGGYDLFKASRSMRTEPWGQVVAVEGVNTAGDERYPMVTGDGLTMYAVVGTASSHDIAIAARASTAEAFGALQVAAIINDEHDSQPGTILPGQEAIWFASNRRGNYDLYRASRVADQLTNPALISGPVNHPSSDDIAPVVTPDELTLIFASNRVSGSGNFDIWIATRASAAESFGEPSNVQVLSSSGLEVPTWLSADGCVLYLTRGTLDSYDLYVAERGM
jgi:Tol biopolymer transport system component